MKFKQYINEGINEFMEKVKKDCGPWLRSAGENLVYRGISNIWKGVDILYNKKVRTNRTPTDMNKIYQVEYNKLFYNKFGWKPRTEGLFVTGNLKQAYNYGNGMPWIVYPIGEFKFLWNPQIIDLYRTYEIDLEKKVEGYIDTNIKAAIRSKGEIMIKCKSYHAIRTENDFDFEGVIK